MDFLLDRQQINQRIVDPGVRVVAIYIQQTAKSVLHSPGSDRIAVCFDCRQS